MPRAKSKGRAKSTRKKTPVPASPTYQVEAIIKHKTLKSGNKFFIKWKGFDDSENTWETEKNLVSDGLQSVIDQYFAEAEEEQPSPAKTTKKKKTPAKKKKPAKKKTPAKKQKPPKKTPTKRSSRTKTPPRQAQKSTTPKSSAKKRTPSAKSSTKKRPASAQKPRTKTPPRAKSKSPVPPTPTSGSEVAATVNISADGSVATANVELYVWWGLYLLLVCAHLVCVYLLNVDPPKTVGQSEEDTEARNAAWTNSLHTAKRLTAVLPAIVACVALVSHVNSSLSYPKFISVALVWFSAVNIISQLTESNAEGTASISHAALSVVMGCVARLVLIVAFQSSDEDGGDVPINAVRSLPFLLLLYFFEQKLNLTSVLQTKDAQQFGECFLIASTLLCGWRASARVGYGHIGWRSRRATKQIVAVLGCLSLVFSMMLEFKGKPLLDFYNATGGNITALRMVVEWLSVGLFATSGLMYCVDEA